MIHISIIRENTEKVIDLLAIKNFDAKELVLHILETDNNKRGFQKQFDDIQAEANSLAKEIGQLFKEGKQDLANDLKAKTVALKSQSKEIADRLTETEKQLEELLVQLPNLPHETVPKGKSAEDNIIVFQNDFETKKEGLVPHWELTQKYDIVDFELGNKITGAGFPVYKGKGAKLQRALINYFLDKAEAAGYNEVQPPLFVNEDSAYATGQLPDKDGQMYHIGLDNFYLIPTAEVPITNIYRNVMLNHEQLPLKNVGYTPCFRREAGSYGKDVRGLNRLHQFDKVEIVQIQIPEKSYETLEDMKSYVCSLLEDLGLPYRVLKLCGGDMSFTSAMTYDMEVYSMGQNRWLEVSSVSNFESYQANRMKLRYKDESNKSRLLHTLNGSALALPRIMASIIENYQTPEGILVPQCLVPYTKFEIIN